jgi:hypothetical protein
MLRRVLVVSLLALGVVGCGGSSPTEVPPTPTAAASVPVESAAPSEAPSVEPAATTLAATCDSIGIRKTPSTTGELVTRISRGATIHVVQMVTGDSYTVGGCGTSGDTWYELDQINDKSVQSLYGVEVLYSAAGVYK